MSPVEVIAALDALTDDDDQEAAHARADQLLADSAPPEVAEAWHRARERVGFWYA